MLTATERLNCTRPFSAHEILAEDSGDLAATLTGDGSVDARDLSALMKILAEQE